MASVPTWVQGRSRKIEASDRRFPMDSETVWVPSLMLAELEGDERGVHIRRRKLRLTPALRSVRRAVRSSRDRKFGTGASFDCGATLVFVGHHFSSLGYFKVVILIPQSREKNLRSFSCTPQVKPTARHVSLRST